MTSDVHDSSNRHRYRKGRLLAAAALAGLLAVPATAAASQASATQAAASTSCPWVTSRAPIAQRVAQLMSQMSLADEISMVEGHGTANPYVFYTPAIPSLCIPAVGLEDGPSGVADGLTGVTQLPAGVALAATWDPRWREQYGQVIGAEEYGKGASANLGPTVNIDRDPRWGRSFEALSEDPEPERRAQRERDRGRAEPGRDVPGEALRRCTTRRPTATRRPTTSWSTTGRSTRSTCRRSTRP